MKRGWILLESQWGGPTGKSSRDVHDCVCARCVDPAWMPSEIMVRNRVLSRYLFPFRFLPKKRFHEDGCMDVQA